MSRSGGLWRTVVDSGIGIILRSSGCLIYTQEFYQSLAPPKAGLEPSRNLYQKSNHCRQLGREEKGYVNVFNCTPPPRSCRRRNNLPLSPPDLPPPPPQNYNRNYDTSGIKFNLCDSLAPLGFTLEDEATEKHGRQQYMEMARRYRPDKNKLKETGHNWEEATQSFQL